MLTVILFMCSVLEFRNSSGSFVRHGDGADDVYIVFNKCFKGFDSEVGRSHEYNSHSSVIKK